MSDEAHDVYERIWQHLHYMLDIELMNEEQSTREYVTEMLQENFRFTDHMFIKNVSDRS